MVSRVPYLQYSSSSSALEQFRVWRIESEPHFRYALVAGTSAQVTSQDAANRAATYNRMWLDEIRKRLAKDDHFQFYDNPPFDATIMVVLYGQVRPSKDPNGDKSSGSTVDATISPRTGINQRNERKVEIGLGQFDRVDSVTVIILDPARKHLGQIKFSRDAPNRNSLEEIEPKLVADAIKKMVKGEAR